MSKSGFYITTAIAYPNSRMHVGFAWEVIGSDMIARFHRMLEVPVFFCTGTDEHSQNVEKAAVAAGQTAKAYCDQMAEDIEKVMLQMDVAYDRFIRTSDTDHERVCQYLIAKSQKNQDIYKQSYEGLYCDSCEVFYTEKEISEAANVCPVHKKPVRKMAEENYFFKLSAYEDKLKALFKNNPHFLDPEKRRNEVVSFLENGLKDFSVSRTSFKWGIPVPFESGHIIYVWFDALINYLSAIQYPIYDDAGKCIQGDQKFFDTFWPCDVHVIGKDITRFHCLYWPAMLMSTKVELPKKVWAHGFIELDGEKMSKTRGNIVTPDRVISDYGADALRWYLLSATKFDSDGAYSDQALVLKCNADLANNIGNLVNRVLNMTLKYFPEERTSGPKDYGVLPEGVVSLEKQAVSLFGKQGALLKELIEHYDLSQYCQRLVEFSMAMNKYVDEVKPWTLAKTIHENDATKQKLSTALRELLEGIRLLAIGLWPVIPQTSMKIFELLGVSQDANLFTEKTPVTSKQIRSPRFAVFEFSRSTHFDIQQPVPLFKRLEFIEKDAH